LAPRRTPILSRQSQRKILLKKGGKRLQEGGLGQNPQRKTRNKTIKKAEDGKKKHLSTGIYTNLLDILLINNSFKAL